jgi:hypothetical protein
MFLIFVQEGMDSAILSRHKIQPSSSPQLKKCRFVRQDEHVEWNTNVLGTVQRSTVEILTGSTLVTGSTFIDPTVIVNIT